jgi:hypothetical protein
MMSTSSQHEVMLLRFQLTDALLQPALSARADRVASARVPTAAPQKPPPKSTRPTAKSAPRGTDPANEKEEKKRSRSVGFESLTARLDSRRFRTIRGNVIPRAENF